MNGFDSVKFAMDNEGYNIYDMLDKAYQQGREDAIKELQKYAEEKLDMRFSLDVLCKQVIDEYIEQMKEQKNDSN